ncbi:TPA: hypothetical protein I8V89_002468 [Corynebacterium striatum]|uniref:Fido domain-containing protein n=1 Tax=Corynebacterium striatum TaxID=43770 RepID=A0ABC8CT91_CORST|nr:Fic family protein [Corynebacterium striatum]ATZ07321.1 hypothetical protein BBR43_11245 [Corynebacterium striatum]ATZ09910.1 hypothetical protein A9D01_09330 [Corynebacterium striatum]EGT5592231.1 hypothetical protein [Corynebacterium striatum]EGT5613133.1 hypothetical protein [Corynebacterium striatum]KAA1271098.1 hypothetical protein D7S42_04720 [Corynebacterium striatum]
MRRATSRVSWEHHERPHVSELGTDRALFRLAKQLPDLVWNAVALEGNTFTLPEVRTLLDAGLFRGEGDAEGDGGGVRLMDGGFIPFDPADELGEAHADLLVSLQGLENPVEQALAYFCSATRSQFYFDGNKRTARLVASGLLLSHGYSALNIPHARQLEFNLALDELFRADDATALMDFLYDCLEESSQ